MPLIRGKSKKAVGENIKTEMAAGKPQKQSIAIALNVQRKAKKKMASGGPVPSPSPSSDQDKAMESIRKAFGGKRYAQGGRVDISEEKRTADHSDSAESRDMLDQHPLEHEGEIRAASERPSADEMRKRGMEMAHKARGMLKHADEIDARKEHMSGIDDARDSREMDMLEAHSEHHDPRRKFAKGGEVDAREESMSGNSIDDAHTDRDEEMLDAHPSRHGAERRAAESIYHGEDEEDSMEMDMLHAKGQPDEYSKEGLINYAKGGSVAERIRSKKMMAEGGEVDLQDNEDEHLNKEDQLSYGAARKKTYFDLDQSKGQPEDSNEHSDEIEKDLHDMVSKIRSKMKHKLRK